MDEKHRARVIVDCCMRPERNNLNERDIHNHLEKLTLTEDGVQAMIDARQKFRDKIRLLNMYIEE